MRLRECRRRGFQELRDSLCRSVVSVDYWMTVCYQGCLVFPNFQTCRPTVLLPLSSFFSSNAAVLLISGSCTTPTVVSLVSATQFLAPGNGILRQADFERDRQGLLYNLNQLSHAVAEKKVQDRYDNRDRGDKGGYRQKGNREAPERNYSGQGFPGGQPKFSKPSENG